MRGGHGGPWGIFINTYELESIRPVRFDLDLAGLDSSVKAGDLLELELATITNPVTGMDVHPRAVLPEGLVCRELTLGASRTFRVNGSVSYDHSGKYAGVAPFEYSS